MSQSRNHNGNGNHRRAPRHYDYAAIYRWLVAYKIAHDGNSPSYGDLMRGCGISSRSVVNHILAVMERAGFITRAGAAKRGIEIVGATWTPPAERV